MAMGWPLDRHKFFVPTLSCRVACARASVMSEMRRSSPICMIFAMSIRTTSLPLILADAGHVVELAVLKDAGRRLISLGFSLEDLGGGIHHQPDAMAVDFGHENAVAPALLRPRANRLRRSTTGTILPRRLMTPSMKSGASGTTVISSAHDLVHEAMGTPKFSLPHLKPTICSRFAISISRDQRRAPRPRYLFFSAWRLPHGGFQGRIGPSPPAVSAPSWTSVRPMPPVRWNRSGL